MKIVPKKRRERRLGISLLRIGVLLARRCVAANPASIATTALTM
jgi:hypothetical protein